MKKYSKKIALILALTLVLAIAIPALAATETKIAGTYEEVPINVIVPGDIKAVLNPMNYPVKAISDVGNKEVGDLATAGQIASQPMIGLSKMEVKMNVGAIVTGTQKGLFEFDTDATGANVGKEGKEKTGLVKLQVQAGKADMEYKTASDTTICNFPADEVVKQVNSWKQPTKYTAKDKGMVLVTTTETTGENLCTLAPYALDKNNVKTVKGCMFMARLVGKLEKSADWASNDGLEVNITWTFEPA